MSSPQKGGFFIMLDDSLLELQEGLIEQHDPLHLDLEDDVFVDVIDQWVSDSQKYYANKNLKTRQKRIMNYYMGKHDSLDENKKNSWQVPYVENVVYEGIRRVKPIATSRLPDLTVKSSSNPEAAKLLTNLTNTELRDRQTRKMFGLAHVQERLFLYSVIKARWNPESGSRGDYEFLNVHPNNVVWDHTCKTNNADDMLFVAELAEVPVKDIIMMFPKKKEEIMNYLGVVKAWTEEQKSDQKMLASTMGMREVWFHWYKDTKDEITGKTKWEKVNGVVWKMEHLVLGKMRNPYFDYEGKINLFTKEIQEKQPYNIYQAIVDGLQPETVYNNYFKTPRKPYYFMVYESLGDDPINATSSIEQILPFQDHINDEGRQIIEMNERSAGKAIFNSEAIDKDTVKKLDWRNFSQAISVNGEDVNKALAFALPKAADASLYKSKETNRSIAFEMIGIGATTRGVSQGDQTLGEAQMFREADFGFLDDLVEDTINDLAEWRAGWAMQFIKLFYTAPHFVEVLGKDGNSVFAAIHQDLVEDGMIVSVSASATDKLNRKRMAIENLKLGVGDLLTYYEDTEQSNPIERARRAWMAINAPNVYFQQFLGEEGEGVPGPVAPPPGQVGQPPVQEPPASPNAGNPLDKSPVGDGVI